MGWVRGDTPSKLLGRGQDDPVLFDHAADGFAETKPLGRADQHREIQIPSRLLPCPENARRGVLANRLAGMALEGEFPVVDDAGSLSGEVCGQAGLDQPVQQRPRAVLDEVCAVG